MNVHIDGTMRWTKDGDASDAEVTMSIENEKISRKYSFLFEWPKDNYYSRRKPFKSCNYKISHLANMLWMSTIFLGEAINCSESLKHIGLIATWEFTPAFAE